MSNSEAHGAIQRAVRAGLLVPSLQPVVLWSFKYQVARSALSEFLCYGLKYMWPGQRGAITRGVVTGASLPQVQESLNLTAPAVDLVWPYPEGTTRGESLEPLSPSAVLAASRDQELHLWLALVDMIRLRTGRELSLAAQEIQRRLKS